MNKKILQAFILSITFSLFLMNNAYAFTDQNKVDIHGFLSQGYLKTTSNNWLGDTKDGTWDFREMGINFTTLVNQRLRLGMQIFTRDLADIGNDEIIIDWAYADYNVKDWLGIRAGQIKNPQGLYNETRDLDFLRINTFVSQILYNESARDAFITTKGIGLYGNIDAHAAGSFRYIANCGTTSIPNDSGTARTLKAEITTNVTTGIGTALFQAGLPAVVVDPALAGIGEVEVDDFDVENSYTIGLEWQPLLEGLRLAGSYNRTDFSADYFLPVGSALNALGVADVNLTDIKVTQDLWTASLEYNFRDITLTAEYLRATIDTGEERATYPEGWYGMISYRFLNWLAAGYSYGQYYSNRSDKQGRNIVGAPDHKGWLKQQCLFARIDISENWLIKGEVQFNNGTANINALDNLEDNGSMDLDQRWDLLALKMTYNF